MGSNISKKKEKSFKNKKKDKINSKKFWNEEIDYQMNDLDDPLDYNEQDIENIDKIPEEKLRELGSMEEFLDIYKEDIEETYSFIKKYLEKQLDKTGIYYSVKLRSKSGSSTKKKIIQKYDRTTYKIQDIIGVRILLNFVDDIDILKSIFKKHPLNIQKSQSIKNYRTNEFGIMKTNYVWKMNLEDGSLDLLGANEEQKRKIQYFKEEIFDKYPIDQTFEIQVRTSTFDSYHEIDHEMRYKNGNTWNLVQYPEENRRFNGILATLEICDWSMSQLIDDMAHEQYDKKNWVQMFLHRFKVKLNYPKEGSAEEKELLEFCEKLTKDKNYAHDVYKVKRDKLITYFWNNKEDKDSRLNYHILIKGIKSVLNETKK